MAKDDLKDSEDKPAAAAAGAPLFRSLLKGRLARIVGYSLVAVLLVVVSIVVARLVIGSVQKKGDSKVRSEPVATFDLGEFKLNTADKVEPLFLDVQVVLGYSKDEEKVVEELSSRRIELLDRLNAEFGKMTKDQLDTAEKQKMLKEKIKFVVNKILVTGQIEEVFFPVFSLM